MKSLGQIAYEAYCNATGWKSLATGADLPKWDCLNVDIRDAWESAGDAIQCKLNELISQAARQHCKCQVPPDMELHLMSIQNKLLVVASDSNHH